MSIAITMPALSPTMEEGTLAKWLVKVGDTVRSGDVMAEIETDKATMEFEAVDEGVIANIAVPEGTEGVKVGTVIATLAEEGEDPKSVKPASGATASAPIMAEAPAPTPAPVRPEPVGSEAGDSQRPSSSSGAAPEEKSGASTSSARTGDRILASPLAKRIAADKGIDLASVQGSGPHGRIVKADVEGAQPGAAPPKAAAPAAATQTPEFGAPYEAVKLNNVRKTIARRLTEAKQTVPHYYLTIDVRLDPLLKLRAELNAALEGDGIKLSVNDLLIKALAKALLRVPQTNVSFADDELRQYSRADISVAVAAPSGLITPIVTDAGTKAISQISSEMKGLVEKAKEGKLQPHEYQGGTASLSNLGMFGIKQFDAVINPPQGMILAVGAGDKRPFVVDGALAVATVLSATGSFDHRAIDGADGAQLMQAFQDICEKPLALVA